MGIVIFGAVFVDIKGYPDNKFIPGGRNVGRVIQTHGGVSRNVAEDIANVGLRPTFVSVVDGSGTGGDVIDHLRSQNVNTDYIVRHPDGMGTWLAAFDNCGDVVASISKRPDLSPLMQVLEEHGDEMIANADSIVAMERREQLRKTACIVCNRQEAGMLFSEDYTDVSPKELQGLLQDRLVRSGIPRMVVTLGADGAVFAESGGTCGFCPSTNVDVIDTTGAGDAFFAGVTIGLTYGKPLAESCGIGTRLACSVISTRESVCPHFCPEEFGLPELPE